MNEFEKAQSAKILACYGDIEKGRKGEIIGSEKNWGGKKYVKTNNGWIPKKDAHISSNKNHMESHKNVVDTKEDSGEKVSLQELQGVLNTMNQYNRQSGYMAFDNGGKFRFFDSMPSFGGAYVTKEDVEGYVRDYGKTDNDISNHTEAISSLVEYAKKIGYDPEKQSLDTLMEKWNEENEKIYNFLKENKDKVKEVVGGSDNGIEIHSVNLMSKNNQQNGFYLYNVILKIGDKYFRSKSIKSDRVLNKKDINVKDLEIQSEIGEQYYEANNIR